MDYQLLKRQVEALIDAEADAIAQLANVTALLFNELQDTNWVGIYRKVGNELVLGPFQGKVACTRIAWNAGVCGTAAASGETLRIADVHAFDGHIACDAASNSELVIPIHSNGAVVAVLDLDSPSHNRFSATDQDGLVSIATLLTHACAALSD